MVERCRVRVWVTPRGAVMAGTSHGDVVILGDALPRAGIRRRAVTEHADTDRGGWETVIRAESFAANSTFRGPGPVGVPACHVLSVPSRSRRNPRCDHESGADLRERPTGRPGAL